jgi:hypothetical protein
MLICVLNVFIKTFQENLIILDKDSMKSEKDIRESLERIKKLYNTAYYDSFMIYKLEGRINALKEVLEDK